jgi:metal-responsive CopG/Arc/MetJ family transcriptional regulator
MYGKNDNFVMINAKVDPQLAEDLDSKIKEAKKKGVETSRSEIVRDLIKMFLRGDVKITKTIGG